MTYFRSLLKKSIPFLGVVYNNVCLQSFQSFSCMQLRDGSSVVSAAPGIICYTDEHNTLMGVAVLALIVYVVGLPAVTLGTTTYARYKDKLRDPVWLDTIGLFYREYEPQHYWWDVMFLMRRLILCLCAVIFKGNYTAQAGVSIVCIVIFTLFQFTKSPFWDKRVNVLDCFCCLGILVHLISYLYYNNQRFISDTAGAPSAGASALDTVLVIVNAVLIASMLALFAVTFAENRLRSYSTSRLSKRVSEILVLFQTELRRNRDQFAQVLTDDLAVNAFEPYQVSDGVVHLELGQGTIKHVAENARMQAVEVEYQKGVLIACETATQLAEIRPCKEPAVGGEKEVYFRHFQQAVHNCTDMQKGALLTTPAAIEATFSILKLLHIDDDRTTIVLSKSARDFMASDRPIPLNLVYEFLGVLAPKTTLFLTRTKAASMAQMSADMIAPLSPKVGKLLTPKSMAGGNSGWPGWRASRVQTVARKVCHEIASTIDPLTMAFSVRNNLQRDSALSGLFCFSAWLAPFIPDYAEIGAFSKHVSSQIYKHAAERMPKLILEAAFGNAEVAQSMRKFMAQWMAAELNVSNGDLELLDQISTKDRGPFLYWLVNCSTREQRLEFVQLWVTNHRWGQRDESRLKSKRGSSFAAMLSDVQASGTGFSPFRNKFGYGASNKVAPKAEAGAGTVPALKAADVPSKSDES